MEKLRKAGIEGKWNLIKSSERRRAEESLRFEKQFSELLINSSFDGILAFDGECQYTVWNRGMERISGVSRSETLGKYAFDVFPFLKETGEDKYFFEALEGKTIIAKDRPYKVPATNQEGFFEGHYSPIRNESGEIMGGLAIIHDITTHKRAEEALRESEKDLNHAQAVAHTGSWRLDVLRNELFWSDETHRIFGIPKETPLTYEAFLATVHPEDRQSVDQSWRAAFRGEPYDIEHRIVVESNVKWVRERAELEFDGKGILLGGFGTVQDITERKQMEEELRRSHDELEIRVQERTYDLNERVKELNCLSLVSYVLNKPDIPFEKVFEETVIMLPSAFQFPEIACARITLRGQEFKTQNYRETAAWKLKSEILSRGKPIGIIELTYLEEKPVCYEGPFLREEKIMINAIALQLGEYIERIETQTELAEQRRILEGFFTSTITPLVLLDKDFNFIRVNEAYAKACQRDASDFPGHNHFEFYPDEENEAIFRRVVETKVPFQAIEKPFGFPGHPEWGVTYWDWTLTPLLDSMGEVEFLVFSLNNVTDRKRVELALRDSELWMRCVFNSIEEGIFIVTPDRILRDINTAAQKMFGYTKEELLNNSTAVLQIDQDHYLEFGRRISEAFDRGESANFEFKTKRKKGDIFPTEHTASLLKNDMGDAIGIVSVVRDITERKRAEQQLEAASLYAKSLIEASLDPLVTISRDGKIMDVNRATELVTGVHREQLIGSDFSDYFTEPEKAKKGYEEVFSKGFVTDYPLAIRNISGRVTEVLYNAAVYKNEHGEVQGVFAAARDITERKQVEDSLREREALLRTVFETLPVGVWITDKQGRISRGNPAGQQIWAGARYVGIDQFGEYKGWWVDTGKRIEPEEWAAARAVLKGETSINEEIEIECFDGSHKIILNSAVPIRDERQEILGAFIVNQDITERRRSEKAIRQMQKMEALGTLAGGIAHDFNNILMPIVINTELALLDTPDGSPISNYLKLVQEAANRGKDLIKQIITFSRQKEQVKVPIEIGPVLKEALKFLRSSIPKNIEIRENIEVSPSSVLADPTQIHQVLMNLCSNAAYSMREKGGVLDVSLTPVEVDTDMVNRHLDLKPGPYFRLTVADMGQGMDKEITERIFDPFFTTKKPGEGTGMGLAVVHGIVKNHGGAVTVYSEVGKGSTFNVFLPMIKEELKTETAPSESITTGKERILLIDDEEIQIRSVQPMLERLGYKVIGKTDALEALGLFKEQPDAFDLVITDQTMPHLTGRELAEELLRIRPDIPIILCTGFSEVIHEEEAKSMGIREFIMKPFSLNEMAGIIRRSLKRNG